MGNHSIISYFYERNIAGKSIEYIYILTCLIYLTEQNQSLSLIQRLAKISTEVSGEDLTDVCPMTGAKRRIINEVPPVTNKWKPDPKPQQGMKSIF